MIANIIHVFGGRLGASIAGVLAVALVGSLFAHVTDFFGDWWQTRKLNKQIESLQKQVTALSLDKITLKTSNTAMAAAIEDFERAVTQGENMAKAMASRNALLANQVLEKERIIDMIQDEHRRDLERAYARNLEWAAVRWPDDVVDSMCDYYKAIGVLVESGNCEGAGVPPAGVPGLAPDGLPSIPLDGEGDDGESGERLASLQHHDYWAGQRTQGGDSRYGVH